MDFFIFPSATKGCRAVGRDGTVIRLHGGGVIRVRPDGTDLEIVSTGERNPLSVALSETDEIFTYGNDDDSKKWPNSLTHHIVGGHYGYPYEFLTRPNRCLPIVTGKIGGSGTQGCSYDEDGLPALSRLALFLRLGLADDHAVSAGTGGRDFQGQGSRGVSFKRRVERLSPLLDCSVRRRQGDLRRRLGLRRLARRRSENGPRVSLDLSRNGRRRTRSSAARRGKSPRSITPRAVRLEAQRALAKQGTKSVDKLIVRLNRQDQKAGGMHALWRSMPSARPRRGRRLRGVEGRRSRDQKTSGAERRHSPRQTSVDVVGRASERSRTAHAARKPRSPWARSATNRRRLRYTKCSATPIPSHRGRFARRFAGSTLGTKTRWFPPCSTPSEASTRSSSVRILGRSPSSTR